MTDQTPPVPVNMQPAKKPPPIKPGAEWSIEYARERDAPPSHFLAFVETQGQVDNAEVDFVEIPPGNQTMPRNATGERQFVRTPAGRYLYERGSHVIYMRIIPAPSACSEGKSVRVSIAIEGNALVEGTPAGLTVAEKVSTCEPIIRRVATFTIP